MRVKFQVRSNSGVYRDMLVDPAHKHMLALDFTPEDLMYIERRKSKMAGNARLILPAIPIRIKTRVTRPDGRTLDIVADRTNMDWIALELTPDDIRRLVALNPGPDERLITYAGPNPGKNPIGLQDINRFKSEWPDYCSQDPNEPKEIYGGVPKLLADQGALAGAFLAWANEWPPVFHNSHKAPEAQLILPDGTKV